MWPKIASPRLPAPRNHSGMLRCIPQQHSKSLMNTGISAGLGKWKPCGRAVGEGGEGANMRERTSQLRQNLESHVLKLWSLMDT